MLSEREFAWVAEQVQGDYDHLLVGTSLPWLLPRALHDLESWNERLASGSRGRLMARWAEKVRRSADLEHWAAFRKSFDRLARLFERVGSGEETGGRPPATICVLSGDVHHAYAAGVRFPRQLGSKVYQLTCSPLHNYVPGFMKVVFRISWNRATERTVRLLLRGISGVPAVPVEWTRLCGPYFGDQIATLELSGRSARLVFEQAGAEDGAAPGLAPVAELELS